MEDAAEIVHTIERLQTSLEELAVRGLRSAGSQDLKALTSLREEFQRIGAEHLAGRIATLSDAIRNDDRASAAALLRAQSSLRVFERILTLEAAHDQFERALQTKEGEQP